MAYSDDGVTFFETMPKCARTDKESFLLLLLHLELSEVTCIQILINLSLKSFLNHILNDIYIRLYANIFCMKNNSLSFEVRGSFQFQKAFYKIYLEQ